MPSFPFKKSREAEIAAKHKASLADQDRIEKQIAEGKQEVVRCQDAAVNAVVAGAPPDIVAKANAEIAAAEQAVKTAEAARAQVESRIVELERERDELANKKLAAATSGQIEDMMAEVAAVNADLQSVCVRLAQIGRKAATFVPEAATLENFGKEAPTAIGDVTVMVTTLMRNHRRDVLAGLLPPTIRAPDEPLHRPVPTPEPATVELVAMSPLALSEGVGVRLIPQGQLFHLPKGLLDHALKHGVAAPLNKYEARELHDRWTRGRLSKDIPPFAKCFPLDDAAVAGKSEAMQLNEADVTPKEVASPASPVEPTHTRQPPAEKNSPSYAPQFTAMHREPFKAAFVAQRSPVDE